VTKPMIFNTWRHIGFYGLLSQVDPISELSPDDDATESTSDDATESTSSTQRSYNLLA
jgi:hypothetical protein